MELFQAQLVPRCVVLLGELLGKQFRKVTVELEAAGLGLGGKLIGISTVICMGRG
jgi:hypothetical protein